MKLLRDSKGWQHQSTRGSARCAFAWCITLRPNWSLCGTAAIINVLADAFKRMAIAISMVTAPSIFMEFFIKPPLCVVTSLKCVYVMRVHAYTWRGRWRLYVQMSVCLMTCIYICTERSTWSAWSVFSPDTEPVKNGILN